MNNVSRLFNIIHWPIWAKITAGLLMAVVVPLLVGAMIIESSFGAYSLNAKKDSLAQTGDAQLKAITNLLHTADADLENIATSTELNASFIKALNDTGVDPRFTQNLKRYSA